MHSYSGVDTLKKDKQETLEEFGRRVVLKRWEETHGSPPSAEDKNRRWDGLLLDQTQETRPFWTLA